MRGTEDVRVGKGSVLNADSGAAIAASGKLIGGRGGDVNVELALSRMAARRAGRVGVTFDGTAHAYGVTGSGTFRLSSDKVRIGGAGAAQPGVIVLSESLFAQGFSRYEINGNAGLEIADGAMVRPSCRFIVRVQST